MIMVDLKRANSRVATVELRNVSFVSLVHPLTYYHSVRYFILWVDIQSPGSLLCKHCTLPSHYRALRGIAHWPRSSERYVCFSSFLPFRPLPTLSGYFLVLTCAQR